MNNIEQLQKAISASSAHQERLQAVKSEEEAVSTLLNIANAENIALERADLERQIATRREKSGELSDDELAAVSGGFFGSILAGIGGHAIGAGISMLDAVFHTKCTVPRDF